MSTRIDPETRDYLVTAQGALEQGSEHANAVMIALWTEKGSVPGEPSMGSELHRLRNAKLTSSVLPRAEDMVRQAFAQLVDLRIQLETVKAALKQDGITITIAYSVDRQRHVFTHFVRVL